MVVTIYGYAPKFLVVACALLTLPAGEALAWWSPAPYGRISYTSYYTVPYGYYGYYYPGPLRRMTARVRARRAARAYYYGPYAGYGGTSGYYYAGASPYESAHSNRWGEPGCDPCSDPCCCEVTPISSPATKPAEPTPAKPTLEPEQNNADQSAKIELALPATARVTINDRPTTSTGDQRQYVSAKLHPGKLYAYRIRVEYQQAGQPIVQQRVVHLRAGQQATVDFPDSGSAKMATNTNKIKMASLK